MKKKIKMGKTERVSATGKHNGEVTCVLVDKGYVYSGGADGIIKVRINE